MLTQKITKLVLLASRVETDANDIERESFVNTSHAAAAIRGNSSIREIVVVVVDVGSVNP